MPRSMFNTPIPGNSLTVPPKSRPWERPPEAASVEEALSFYMTRLADQEIIDDFMVALESGIPMKPMVEALYMSHVMRGIHTLDVGILIAPALTEFFSAVADSYDIKYKYTKRDPKEAMAEKERTRITMLLNSAISRAEEEGTEDEGTEMLRSMLDYTSSEMTREEAAEAPVQAEEMEVEQPTEEMAPATTEAPSSAGLMSPRG